MDTNMRELPVPPSVASAPDAVEFIRAWRVGDAMHVSLNHTAWQRPAAWGIALADIVQHFANSCEQSEGWPRENIVKQVTTMFNAELDNPTDKPTGGFLR
jgi:hypothetical protein